MANVPANRAVTDEIRTTEATGTTDETTKPTETTETTEGRVGDVGYDPEAASEYECLACGELLVAASHPGSCPQCGATPRNRSMPSE
jgi:magnesium transporter